MQEIKIINYISLHGREEVLFDSLTEEEKKEAAILIQDRFMQAAGYQRRKSA